MKIKESKTMVELREIREALGQKYRDLSAESQVRALQKEGEKILRKYRLNLRRISLAPHR